MADEQGKTLEGLKMAIQMEIDGKEFYSKAATESGNELGRKLLAALAAEEDIHRKVFQGIYEAIREKHGWPAVDFHPDHGQALRTVFSETISVARDRLKSNATELDAVQTARQMEGKTYDYYQGRARQAVAPAEKEFYERLSAQEQEHSIILSDYYEFLQNPAGWFVKKEHPHLD